MSGSGPATEPDPRDYPVDEERYRRADASWLRELDHLAVHAGEPQQRMGTRAVDPSQWLVFDEHEVEERALRARLLAEAEPAVHRTLPGSEAAGREVADMVRAWLAEHRSVHLDGPPMPSSPLLEVASAIQEDLCVMERDDAGAWRLTSAVVCFPTHWKLEEKIGGHLDGIHQPVAHYDTDLSGRIDRFFDRLPDDRLVVRRNWGFATAPLLFIPTRTPRLDDSDFDPDRLWFRSERQTLRRLPETGAMLFTIKIQQTPLSTLARWPVLAAGVRAAIEGWSPELRRTRGNSPRWLHALLDWLAQADWDA